MSLRLVIFGTLLSTTVVFNESKKLDGYKFPVYSTQFCPRNESEWNKRSSVLNCNNTNGYTCLPNEKLTELLEFCYTQPWILIEEGYCLYLERKGSYVDSYRCLHFIQGCHNTSFQSIRIYEHPACISIGNGCFLAEQSCKSSSKTTQRPQTTENEKVDWLWVVIFIGIIVPIVCFSSFMLYLYRTKRICKQGTDIENVTDSEENMPLINRESQLDRAIFDQWEQEDSSFIQTKACIEVEKNIKNRNLVIVAGYSGSGKSAIIQHIALKYRKQCWTVRRVQTLQDIRNEYSSNQFKKNKTMFVFNDPLGKEYFDDILNNYWQIYEEDIKLVIKTAKLVMSCRSHIISDARLARFLVNHSHIVKIDNNEYKLSKNEKRLILTKYTPEQSLSEKDCDKIVEVERYFPLLCKLYSSKDEYKNKGIGFFTEPVAVLKEEIAGFRNKDKGKYCALALLVLFNNDLRVSDLLKTKENECKFKRTLNLCGLLENTSPFAIGDYLYSIKDCFVKRVDDTYTFYHDFVLEVTTNVFGTDYPTETVKYADIGFLRRRVRIEKFEEHNDSFNIYLSERYIQELGERLYTELFGERLLDVVLNPCLRNEKVIEVLKDKIADHPENLLKTKKLTIDEQELYRTSENLLMSKLEFVECYNEVCPLFVLIVFCHTELSLSCVKTLLQNQINLNSSFMIFAICCNGSTELFDTVFKNNPKESLKKAQGGSYPIHIVSVFQKYELLDKFIKIGIDVNQKIGNDSHVTPLMLAAGNDTQEYGHYSLEESSATRRDKTVQLLLSNGADINLCNKDGVSPLYIACENGHDSTVQLLLRNGADINLCEEEGASPLYIACANGHDSTVQHLLRNGANINLCMENGASPLYIACQNAHNSTVQLLLSNGADINLCARKRASPLHIACQNGNDSTVHHLLSNGANINLCDEDGFSPLYIARRYGHDSIVKRLLSNGADINLLKKKGTSPLFI